MSSDETSYELYRFANLTSTKDWAIGVAACGSIRIRTGETGATATLDEIPATHFENAAVEVQRQIMLRLGQGYSRVGSAKMNRGRLEVEPPRPAGAIDWKIVKPIERKALFAHLRSIVKHLNAHPRPSRLEWSRGILQVHSTPAWTFGFSRAGGLGSDGSGKGMLVSAQGVIPRLVITSLHRAFPAHLQLSDGTQTLELPAVKPEDPLFAAVQDEWEWVVELGGRIGFDCAP